MDSKLSKLLWTLCALLALALVFVSYGQTGLLVNWVNQRMCW